MLRSLTALRRVALRRRNLARGRVRRLRLPRHKQSLRQSHQRPRLDDGIDNTDEQQARKFMSQRSESPRGMKISLAKSWTATMIEGLSGSIVGAC